MPDNQRLTMVIGAGLAGLAAAQRIAAAGDSVIILEARDRPGGRVHTLRPAGWPVPVETGAEFIHGRPPELWDVVNQAGLYTEELTGDDLICSQGELQPFDMGAVWGPVFQRLRRISDADLPFAEFLERDCPELSPHQKRLATAYVEGFNAADSRLVSCRWLIESDEASGHGGDAGAYRLPGGYDRVLEWFTQQLPHDVELRLNTVVSEIRWSRSDVVIHSQSIAGVPSIPLHADRVVITLPWGVLRSSPGKQGAVRFVPDLTEKWNACSALQMGTVVKLMLRFRERFWDRAGGESLGFLHAKEQPFPTWWTTAPRQTAVLTGWVGGSAAERLAGLPPEKILAIGLDSLAASLSFDRQRVADLLADWHLTDWNNDPFSRGAYSYVGVGGLDAPQHLAEPVEETLFFAGEATHGRLSATVAGAIASGYRAAAEVLHSRDK